MAPTGPRSDDENVPLADRRTAQEREAAGEDDFAAEFEPSHTDPANQPEDDPGRRAYGESEGYDRPTSA
ncbi:hypothetical protein Sru01_50060 [Sphaerisporangium rufum]|uniref:Uncharacterized protein n=1 Tax=Sphaerisporangium rufum TaxID=1381558 RepID=A0A919V1S0_9ACTN|nr:hypothetical protein [Sphaerisporangium rufum]GII80024.1 hypothetical protein Sru01_50060 [Sphaerisporangium rufum]